ncbi:MAG: hypothetical protein U1F30_04340 [Steroidobacteraceae bacterium]
MADRPNKNAPDPGTKPGAVKHDSRGNAVWQWAVDTGKHALDSTSALLRRLDMPGLTLEGDKPPEKKPDPKEAQLEVEKRQGYDPYGRGRRGGARPPGTAHPPAAPRAPSAPPPSAGERPLSPPAPAPEVPRPSWLGRLFGRR